MRTLAIIICISCLPHCVSEALRGQGLLNFTLLNPLTESLFVIGNQHLLVAVDVRCHTQAWTLNQTLSDKENARAGDKNWEPGKDTRAERWNPGILTMLRKTGSVHVTWQGKGGGSQLRGWIWELREARGARATNINSRRSPIGSQDSHLAGQTLANLWTGGGDRPFWS